MRVVSSCGFIFFLVQSCIYVLRGPTDSLSLPRTVELNPEMPGLFRLPRRSGWEMEPIRGFPRGGSANQVKRSVEMPHDPLGTRALTPRERGQFLSSHLLTGSSPEPGPFTPWSPHLFFHLLDLFQAGCLLLLQLLLVPLQVLLHLGRSKW